MGTRRPRAVGLRATYWLECVLLKGALFGSSSWEQHGRALNPGLTEGATLSLTYLPHDDPLADLEEAQTSEEVVRSVRGATSFLIPQPQTCCPPKMSVLARGC